jgi:pyroglutamyl-peptidase
MNPAATPNTCPVLLSSFEPFGGESINASEQVGLRLDGTVIEGHRVVAVTLPCTFDGATPALVRHLDAVEPCAVVCLGQAADRHAINPERLAVNLIEARIPDNAGSQPTRQPVLPGGPDSYPSRLPVDDLVQTLTALGIPAAASDSAGVFVCNCVFYGLMHHVAQQPRWGRMPAGFIHVPVLPQQAPAGPNLPLNTIVTGIRAAIGTLLRASRGTSNP